MSIILRRWTVSARNDEQYNMIKASVRLVKMGPGRASSRTIRLQRRRPRADMSSAKPSTSARATLRLSPPLNCLNVAHYTASATTTHIKKQT